MTPRPRLALSEGRSSDEGDLDSPPKAATLEVMNDDLQPEYDLRILLQGGERGKYVERYRAGANLVLLDPDVAKVFPDEKSVNEALRLVIELTKISAAKKRKSAKL